MGTNENRNTTDVIIIGAGMAGLSAADTIKQVSDQQIQTDPTAKPIRYVVLEGSERAGGRTLTQYPELGHLDMGGEFLGAPGTQTYSWAMVQRFGLDTFQTYLPAGKQSVYQAANGTLTPFMDNFPITKEVSDTVATVEGLVLAIKACLGQPWLAMGAKALDAISVQDFIDQNLHTEYGKSLMAIAVRSAFSVEPREISCLYLLHYAATCGSFQAFEDVRGGGDSVRFRYGTQQLTTCLVKAVGADNVLFDRKAKSIAQDGAGVRVTTIASDGTEDVWTARFVIVAMSPGASAKIDFAGVPLPATRVALAKGVPMGHTIKGFAVFKTPFWRANYTGYVLSAKGPADWVMDNCWEVPNTDPPTAPRFEHHSLMTFIVGDRALEYGKKCQAERQAAVLSQLGDLFNARDKVASELVQYVDYDWGANPWSHGCPAGCFAKNVLTASVEGQPVGPALTAPVGRVHWAGSETATDWMGGYMNGALQSGIRAAGEVVNLIADATRAG
jgi:monoamine oxidase